MTDMPNFGFEAAAKPARRSERLAFNAAVQFRKGHTRATVKIVDISTHGARLSAVHVLRHGDTFWIKLPLLEPKEATVVWADEFIIGCRFAQPLHPSVLENLLRHG
jgi:hypothetical protein